MTKQGTSSYGTLYGIGAGPGAPDLLTLRAVKILASVDVILAAASPKNDHSVALNIARQYIPEKAEVVRLDFPMTRNKEELAQSWKKNAETTAAVLRSGKSAAFLTLGDPLIYSTFGYLMQTLQEMAPELPVEVVPGITSYQEAASKTRTVLCEGKETLLLAPGINSLEELTDSLTHADSAIILKTYKNTPEICRALTAAGHGDEVVFASRLGLDNEQVLSGVKNIPEKPNYLSLVLAPKPNRNG